MESSSPGFSPAALGGGKASRGWGARPAWQQPIPSNSYSIHPAPSISQETKVWPYRWKTTSPQAPHQLGFGFHNPNAESALLSVL